MARAALIVAAFVALVALSSAVTCRVGSSLLPSAYTTCTLANGYCVSVDSGTTLGTAYSCALSCTAGSVAGITTSCCQTDNCNASGGSGGGAAG
eukprot:CAMPEP_0113898784 /NCGR_PEP_ID=MMETSP0780_2-20120614/19613_1 /TAXON_ID=652834 /ORGANISM="Palpitomonas bilix" /LENGTH=93 /DNA_ID=CAMNT_0000890769 /DNA_START=37 /DNA_END=314 /DNA_ORIENTATION=+ /assembly_acc=CAM_ASM_000599